VFPRLASGSEDGGIWLGGNRIFVHCKNSWPRRIPGALEFLGSMVVQISGDLNSVDCLVFWFFSLDECRAGQNRGEVRI